MATDTPTTKQVSKQQQITATDLLLVPRVSEKAQHLAAQDKYVFVVPVKANKVSVRKAVEKRYGVKVAFINMVKMEGKSRRYGRSQGKLSDFKKAIISITKDSKKIEFTST